MEINELKKEIKEIANIASSVPESLREKCFEVLLNRLLEGKPRLPIQPLGPPLKPPPPTSLKLPSHIKAFMRRNNVTEEQIGSVVMLADSELHFIKEPSHGIARRGQNEWALLVSLKNGILKNSLTADPEEVRSIVQEKGYYDQPNFATNFKAPKYADFFKKALEPQGKVEALAQDGEKALAELIKSLAGAD